MKAAAKKNDPEAVSDLGYYYFYGIGIKVNLKLALKLYKRASRLGLTRAHYNVGHSYYHIYNKTVNNFQSETDLYIEQSSQTY